MLTFDTHNVSTDTSVNHEKLVTVINTATLSSYASAYAQFNCNLLSKLNVFKEQDDVLKRRKTDLDLLAEQQFSILNALLKEKTQIKEQKLVVKVAQTVTNRNNSHRNKARQKDQNSCIKIPQTFIYKIISNKQLDRLRKKEKTRQMFTCFLCFQTNTQNSFWEQQYLFLKHMQQAHNIKPDLERLIQEKSVKPPCSHIFIKDSLINFSKGLPWEGILYTFFLISKQNYDQLYFCPCQSNRNCSIFIQQKTYRHHYFRCHLINKHLQKRSHYCIVRNKTLLTLSTLQKNPQFLYQQVQENYGEKFSIIHELLLNEINEFTYQNYFQVQPLNVIQLMSCYPGIISVQQCYRNVFKCTLCSTSFITQQFLTKHNQKKHSILCQINKNFYSFDREIFKNLNKQTCRSEPNDKIQIPTNLSQEDQLILKWQAKLMLLKKPKALTMICGQCKTVFRKTPLQYLFHIFCEHSFHPLNSHYIIAMIKQKARQSSQFQKTQKQQDDL